MQKIEFSTRIKAPVEKVWFKMFNDESYRVWTKAFNPTSYFVGDWFKKGSEIKFMGTDDKGEIGGMLALINDIVPYGFMSLKHIGMLKGDSVENLKVEDYNLETYENYYFKEVDGETEVKMVMDSKEEWVEMFSEMWPNALKLLKEICEAKTEKITVETIVSCDLDKVWNFFTNPKHIENWCYASEDWGASDAENDLKKHGKFKTKMFAKDDSFSFDFEGIYIKMEDKKMFQYVLADARVVDVFFEEVDGKTKITEIFDPEKINSFEMQKAGWQAILDNFKKYVESN
jgi:uncharacterized protein YndB with AHSA1/START domain